MAFAALSYGVVHYRDTGRRDAPAVVFVNSLGTDLRIWDAVAERLASDYRVVSYDKRGHGLSSVPSAPYTVAQLSEDLRELTDHCGLERFVLAGVSVGGLIAMQFAIDHPDRLAAVVICDTPAKTAEAPMWDRRIAAVRSGGMEAIADAVLQRWFPDSIRAGRRAEIEGWRNLLLRSPVEGYAGTCAALRDADLTVAAAGISVPALVMVGAEDMATPVELVRATAALMPGARFEVIEGAGHIPAIDQPEAVERLIREHIKEHCDG